MRWQDEITEYLVGGGVVLIAVKTWDWFVRAVVGSKLREKKELLDFLQERINLLEERLKVVEGRYESERQAKQDALQKVNELTLKVHDLEQQLKNRV